MSDDVLPQSAHILRSQPEFSFSASLAPPPPASNSACKLEWGCAYFRLRSIDLVRIHLAMLSVTIVVIAGCRERQEVTANHSIRKSAVSHTILGSSDDRSFSFGPILGKPGLKVSHQFRVKNGRNKSIRVLRSINGKPCCGDVESLKPMTLDPGEELNLRVTLRIDGSPGPLHHLALLETDLPETNPVEFHTFATVYPRFRIVETEAELHGPSSGTISRRLFTVSSFGTNEESPLDLDDSLVKTTLPKAWHGPKVERIIDERIIEISRTLSVILDAAGEPGHRSELITLQRGDEILLQYPFQWEMAAALKAMPSTIIFGSDVSETEKTIVLRSSDGKNFRLTKIESTLAGVEITAEDSGSSTTKRLRLSIERREVQETAFGHIRIYTDHPLQPLVKISMAISGKVPLPGTRN